MGGWGMKWDFESKNIVPWPDDDDNWHFYNLLQILFSLALSSSSDVGSSWQFEGLFNFLFSTVFPTFSVSTHKHYARVFNDILESQVSHSHFAWFRSVTNAIRNANEMWRWNGTSSIDIRTWRLLRAGVVLENWKTGKFKLFNLESSSVRKKSSSCCSWRNYSRKTFGFFVFGKMANVYTNIYRRWTEKSNESNYLPFSPTLEMLEILVSSTRFQWFVKTFCIDRFSATFCKV